MASHDRRRTPRLNVEGRLTVADHRAPCDLRLVNIGLGGVLLAAPVPFPIGEVRHLTFTAVEDGWTFALAARVAYSHERPDPDGGAAPTYVTGFAFVDIARPEIEQAIDMLLARVTDLLTVE